MKKFLTIRAILATLWAGFFFYNNTLLQEKLDTEPKTFNVNYDGLDDIKLSHMVDMLLISMDYTTCEKTIEWFAAGPCDLHFTEEEMNTRLYVVKLYYDLVESITQEEHGKGVFEYLDYLNTLEPASY